MSRLATDYRQRLAGALRAAGPEAPTLCEGWVTKDLANHLYIREHGKKAALGIFMHRFANDYIAATRELEAKGYEWTVDAWAAGPGTLMKPLDRWANALEYFIHYADVVRAKDPNAELPITDAQAAEIHRMLGLIGKRSLSGTTVPVIAFPDGMQRIIFNDTKGVSLNGENVVRISGPIQEIALWAYGRAANSLIFSGPTEKLQRNSM
ncbi:MAG: TIGR03085 family metal-binding protein [Corynebacterium sp.]|nr:TIGR03085 family metal-binding protein [Corynebacterium sp.]